MTVLTVVLIVLSALGGASGRVTGVVVDPSDATGSAVYTGSANGGVWKTTNF